VFQIDVTSCLERSFKLRFKGKLIVQPIKGRKSP
jgi:hypothetical protein